MKAVCLRQQSGMPDVGPCIDRRILRIVNAILPDIKAMMCFGCAQIHPHVPLWRKMSETGQHGKHPDPETQEEWAEHRKATYSHNCIELYSVERSLWSFRRKDERS